MEGKGKSKEVREKDVERKNDKLKKKDEEWMSMMKIWKKKGIINKWKIIKGIKWKTKKKEWRSK